MNALLDGLIRNPGDLPSKLRSLRQAADSIPRESLLLEWGRKHLNLSRESGPEWFRRAWWGLMAGELVRAHLHNSKRRQQVLDLIAEPDWSELEAARSQHGAVILAGAHIGPPKTAMNFLMNQKLPLMIWTDMRNFPAWVKETFAITFLDPSLNPSLLTKSALHLRNHGVLFGTPDVSGGTKPITLERLGTTWTFQRGIPTLARMLDTPVFQFYALWDGDRIRIECKRMATPPADLDAESWTRQWLELFWVRLEQIIQTSPEDLRFLLFADNGAIRRELEI